MDITIALDRNYFTQCIVLVFSIVSTNSKSALRFYILSEDLTEKDKQLFTSYFPQSNVSFSFIQVDSNSVRSAYFAKEDHLTVASYYRILIPSLLPANLKKVLYLDCDMLVTDRLDELWETDISGYSAAVSFDAGCNDIRHFNRLEISTEYYYFNAGVLLINLDYWRANEIQRKAFEFIEANPKACEMHDQDALNKILLGTVKHVSVKFNFLEGYFYGPNDLLVKTEVLKDIYNSITNIVILHYAGGERPKPWHNECLHPHKDLWLSCHKKIFKRDFKKHNRYKGLLLIRKIARILLTKLHLLPSRYKTRAPLDVRY